MRSAVSTSVVAAIVAVACSPSAPARPPAAAGAGRLEVVRSGSQPEVVGSAENFSGRVAVTPLFQANEHRRAAGAYVRFEPGAHSAWHTHPAGQTLVVTDGVGWVQEWGGAKQEIRPGDVVWTPPGVKHWHGATATSAMTHLAVQEHVDGKTVVWMEKVEEAR